KCTVFVLAGPGCASTGECQPPARQGGFHRLPDRRCPDPHPLTMWVIHTSGLVRCPACHPFASLRAGSERSEGSGEPAAQILRCAQDDMQDTAGGRSREIFSPNVYNFL